MRDGSVRAAHTAAFSDAERRIVRY
jgi:hypothetical protein